MEEVHRDRLENRPFTPKVYALYKLGPKALPLIKGALERAKHTCPVDGCRWVLSEVMEAIRGRYSRDFKILVRTVEDARRPAGSP